MIERSAISQEKVLTGQTRFWFYDSRRRHEIWTCTSSSDLPIARAFFVNNLASSGKVPVLIEVFARPDLSAFMIGMSIDYLLKRYKYGEVVLWEQQVPIILCSDEVQVVPFQPAWVWSLLNPDFSMYP